jgi:RsiW-degrading membrane proteinase PrsW (M82 family)
VAPSIFLFWFIHARDVHPEPKRMLLGTALLGAVIAVPVVLLVQASQQVLSPPESLWGKAFWDAFLQAAIPEELFKFAVLMLFCYPSRHFDEPFDGIVYGATVSLGFATLENALYVGSGGLGVAVMRAVMAVPGHTAWGVVMGYYVGRAKFATSGRAAWALFGLLAAIVLHGLYDAPLMTQSAYGLLAVPVLGLSIAWALVGLRKMRLDGFVPPIPYDRWGRPLDPRIIPVAYPAPGYPVVPPPGAAPVAPAPLPFAPLAPEPEVVWTRGSVLRLILGAVLGSLAALFLLACIGAGLGPEGRDPETRNGLILLGGVSLAAVIGSLLLFRSGIARRVIRSPG